MGWIIGVCVFVILIAIGIGSKVVQAIKIWSFITEEEW